MNVNENESVKYFMELKNIRNQEPGRKKDQLGEVTSNM